MTAIRAGLKAISLDSARDGAGGAPPAAPIVATLLAERALVDLPVDRTVVIANPVAAGGWVGRNWESVLATVRSILGDVEFMRTEGPGHARELAGRALWQGAQVILSLGGDGTHSEVVAGIVRDRPDPADVVVGVLPAGTGGDFRRMIEGSDAIEEHARRLLTAEPHAIDVGVLRYRSAEGDELERLFLNESSFGMSGAVCARVNRSSKRLGGRLTYFTSALSVLPFRGNAVVRLLVDGQEIGIFPVTMVMISNGQFAGGGMRFAPEARLADGMLDVTIIKDAGALRLIAFSPRLYSERIQDARLVEYFRGFTVAAEPISGDAPLVEADGDPVGVLPVTTSVIPEAIRVIGVREDVL